MAAEAKSQRRLAPESPRRGDSGDEGGHLFACEYSLQYTGSGARRWYVSTGSQLQRQRGQWDHVGAYNYARIGTQVSKVDNRKEEDSKREAPRRAFYMQS